MKSAADFPKLALPACRLRVSQRGGELCVWDSVRGRWLVLTPEEWVRRHVLGWLEGRGFLPADIRQEHPARINGQPQRADVVAFRGARPALLVECKAPEVAISQSTLDQAFRYNSVLGAPHVMLTNGLAHYIYAASNGLYTPLPSLDELP